MSPKCTHVSQRCAQVGHSHLERDPEAYSSEAHSSALSPVDPAMSQLLLMQLQQQRHIISLLERQQHPEHVSPRPVTGTVTGTVTSSPVLSALPSPRSFLPPDAVGPRPLPPTYLNSTVIPIHAPPARVAGRKSKKANKGVKVHKSNEAGMLLDPKGHPAMQSAASLQIAIRYCSERARRQASQEGALSYDKYVEFDKVVFPSAGCAATGTPAHSQPDFKIKDYCPAVFKELRSLFGVSEADFLESLCQTDPNNPSVPSLRVMGSPGKSGSMFFFSCDMRFIVKTIPKMECKQLRDLLPSSAPPFPPPTPPPPHPPTPPLQPDTRAQVPQPRHRVRGDAAPPFSGHVRSTNALNSCQSYASV
jgi:hypothetical protein